jgi:hypothetical protein
MNSFVILFLVFITHLACQHLAITININNKYNLNFKELIGGPKFLKIHVSIQDLVRNIEMDFIPLYPYREDNIKKLLRGENVQGSVRLKCPQTKSIIDITDDALQMNNQIIIDKNVLKFVKLVNESFPQSLNLISNNCYHFIFHYFKTDNEFDN